MPLIESGTKLVPGPCDGFGGNRRARRLPRVSNVGQDSRYLIVVQLPAEKLGGSRARGVNRLPINYDLSGSGLVNAAEWACGRQGQLCCPISWRICLAVR